MTVICALVEGSRVFMGADRGCSESSGEQVMCAASKIFRLGDPEDGYLVGVAGSIRVEQVIRHAFPPPRLADAEDDEIDAVMYHFVEALRACLTKHRAVAEGKRGDELTETDLLVGVRGRVYTVQTDYAVLLAAEGYAAIGCGQLPALGALHATDGLDPERRVRLALAAAEAFHARIRGPFDVEVLR
jgi:ATP-dependent protease HslVU (ClpYQ) peptidase subunit